MTDEKKDIVIRPKQEIVTPQAPVRRGFEGEQDNDFIMPRAKLLQASNPELADENLAELNLRPGMMVNSLTKDKLPESFIPIFKFNSRILWIARDIGGGMACRSLDGITATVLDAGHFGKYNKDTKEFLILEQVTNGDCRKCSECSLGSWNGDIPPVCSESKNFLVMFEGDAFPVVLSFSNTGLKYGKKLYSLARMMPGDMFGFKYRIKPTKTTNEKGTFFVPDVYPNGKATQEEFQQAEGLYNFFKNTRIKFDDEDQTAGDPSMIENSVTDEM